jgi:hypothetical protein
VECRRQGHAAHRPLVDGGGVLVRTPEQRELNGVLRGGQPRRFAAGRR